MSKYPRMMHTVFDTTDARALAEFYRQLLGLQYRPGDNPPAIGELDDADWLVLVNEHGDRQLAFQQVEHLERTTWPSSTIPMQVHVDFSVTSLGELQRQRERAEVLGARLLRDRSDDPDEALYVLADTAGHPFCILVA